MNSDSGMEVKEVEIIENTQKEIREEIKHRRQTESRRLFNDRERPENVLGNHSEDHIPGSLWKDIFGCGNISNYILEISCFGVSIKNCRGRCIGRHITDIAALFNFCHVIIEMFRWGYV